MKKRLLFILVTVFLLNISNVSAGYWNDFFGGKEIYPTNNCGFSGGPTGYAEWKNINLHYQIQGGGCGSDEPYRYFYPHYQTSNLVFNDVEDVKVVSSNESVITAKVVKYDLSKEEKNFNDYIKYYNDIDEKEFLSYYEEYDKKPTWWEFNYYKSEPKTWWEAYGLDKEPKSAVEVISYGHDLGKATITVSAKDKEDIKINWVVNAVDFPNFQGSETKGLTEILNNLDKYKDIITINDSYLGDSSKKYNFTYEIPYYYKEAEDISSLINALNGKDITILFHLNSFGKIELYLNGLDIKNNVSKGFTYENKVSFDESKYKKEIDTLVDSKFKLYIDFAHEGVAPTTTELSIPLNGEFRDAYNQKAGCYDIEDNDECFDKVSEEIKKYNTLTYDLLYYNKKTKKMEFVKKVTPELVKRYEYDSGEYYLNIDFDLFGPYVLVISDDYKINDVEIEDSYTITYNLNGGYNVSKNPEKYYSSEGATLYNPIKYYNKFLGWYTDSKFKNKVTSIAKGTKGNITLYAKWQPNVYNVKFNANGGSGSMSTLKNVKYSTNIKLANKYKRKGYTFVGWNTKKDNTGTSYKNNQIVNNLTSKDKDTITLYAIWKKNTYSIKYSLKGGINSKSNPSSYTVTTSTITLKSPKATGYKFLGWYKDSKYKSKITSIKKGSTGNITLYAKWQPIKYNVKFSANGASGSMTTIKNKKYTSKFSLTKNKYKRKGYTFIGWNTKKDNTGTSYKNGQSVSKLTSKDKATVTLYAIWKKNTYKITYNLKGGTNNTSNPSTYTVTTSTITLKIPTALGYTFKGWYKDSKYKSKVTSIKKGSTGSISLYAKWQANKYKIIFSGNDATSGKMTSISNLSYGKSYKLKTNSYKKEGYTFTGWNTEKDGTGTSFENGDTIKNLVSKNNGSITLYAMWEKVETEV